MVLQHILLRYNGKTVRLTPNKSVFEAEFYADCRLSTEQGGERLQVSVHPKQVIDFQGVEVRYTHAFAPDCRIFCNGWQSWTESREFRPDEYIEPLFFGAKKWLGAMGDSFFYNYPNKNGCLHSWSYSYIRDKKGEIWLTSLNETRGFTCIEHDTTAGTTTLSTEALELEHSYPALDCWIGTSNPFDKTAYFQAKLPKNTVRLGWTSWYQHYTKINEDIIYAAVADAASLHVIEGEQAPYSIQIDDGWQEKVGDWLTVKKTFPKGMEAVADAIRERGQSPGLWLAPFICEKDSTIFNTKPQWLLQDKQGKPVAAGYNPGWSGWFYALDFYNDEVQAYLRLVLQTAVLRWGFQLLKLDFLYAVCLVPPKNKTRGQVMHDAMTFLGGIIQPHAEILACGVPLASAFGVVEYCRIGADTHLSWEHFWLKLVRHRERVSTQLAVRNTLGRHHLDGRVFANDPDVFLLRESGTKLTATQKQTLFVLNCLLGSVWFISDTIADFPIELRTKYEVLSWFKGRKIESVAQGDDCYEIRFHIDNQSFIAYCNLSPTPKRLNKTWLAAFETIIK